MTVTFSEKTSFFAHDLDDAGHLAANVFSAECNTTPTSSATPSTFTAVPFDTFYAVDGGTIASPPALSGLTYAAGVFTATEDGVWQVNIGVEVNAAAATTSFIDFSSTAADAALRYRPRVTLVGAATLSWNFVFVFRLRASETFRLNEASTGASKTVVNGYALLQLIRLARAVS